MLTPFEFGFGGRFGDGRQWMNWIHRDDFVRLIVHCIAMPALAGPVNGAASRPVTSRTFTASLGHVLGRPAWFQRQERPFGAARGAARFAGCSLGKSKLSGNFKKVVVDALGLEPRTR